MIVDEVKKVISVHMPYKEFLNNPLLMLEVIKFKCNNKNYSIEEKTMDAISSTMKEIDTTKISAMDLVNMLNECLANDSYGLFTTGMLHGVKMDRLLKKNKIQLKFEVKKNE